MIKFSLSMRLAGFVAENPEGQMFFVMVGGGVKCVVTCFQIPWVHYINKLARHLAQCY
jgi:hypothetical protein